jgi:hypothetical protein
MPAAAANVLVVQIRCGIGLISAFPSPGPTDCPSAGYSTFDTIRKQHSHRIYSLQPRKAAAAPDPPDRGLEPSRGVRTTRCERATRLDAKNAGFTALRTYPGDD